MVGRTTPRRYSGAAGTRALLVPTVFAALATATATASANGAYPDGLGILLPTDPSSQAITLATNFGLIRSEDDGRTWQWGCEQAATAGAVLYSLGPDPGDRIYALSNTGLASSDDTGCTWRLAGGLLSAIVPTDYFADPNDANRVLALGRDYGFSPPRDALFASVDGAVTFATTIYNGPSGAALTGVEVARGAPETLVVAMLPAGSGGPGSLIQSNDRGATWRTLDLSATLGPLQDLRIIEIDPANAQRIFLRAIGITTERLAIVDGAPEGGPAIVRAPLEVAGKLTGMLDRADGALLVSGIDASGQGIGFQSSDGTLTFQPWPSAGKLPALRALAERSGRLYGAADDLGADGFALGVSDDDGATWTPILKYSQLDRTMGCAAAQCATTCQYEVNIALFGPQVCAATAGDGGAATPDGDAGDAEPTPLAEGDTGAPPTERDAGARSAGGCALARVGRPVGGEDLVLRLGIGLVFAFVVRTRRRRVVA